MIAEPLSIKKLKKLEHYATELFEPTCIMSALHLIFWSVERKSCALSIYNPSWYDMYSICNALIHSYSTSLLPGVKLTQHVLCKKRQNLYVRGKGGARVHILSRTHLKSICEGEGLGFTDSQGPI